jgi:hypothetical protein
VQFVGYVFFTEDQVSSLLIDSIDSLDQVRSLLIDSIDSLDQVRSLLIDSIDLVRSLQAHNFIPDLYKY